MLVVIYISSWINNEKIKNHNWGMKELFTLENTREQFECDKHLHIITTKIPMIDSTTTTLKTALSAFVVLLMVSYLHN